MPEAILTISGEDFLVKASESGAGDDVLILHAAQDIADKILETARALAPKRTGQLAAEGLDSHVAAIRPGHVEVHAGLKRIPRHGLWVHEGTGLYGPFHKLIRPLSGNVMHFIGNLGPAFARYTKGQRPQPFLQEAVLIIENTYIPARLKVLEAELTDL